MYIRHCGLRDSNLEGVQAFAERLERKGKSAQELISMFSGEIPKILDAPSQVAIYEKHGIAMVPSSFYKRLGKQGKIPQEAPFDKKFKGYDFKLGFIQDNGRRRSFGEILSKKSDSDNDNKFGTLFIDDIVIQKSLEKLGDKDFSILEKAIGYIFTFSNHDSTIHSKGFVVDNINFSYVNRIMGNIFQGYSTENLAIMIHRGCFEKIDETTNIKKGLLGQVENISSILDKIEDPNIRYYWNQVLKNGLFTLISPEDEELVSIANLHSKLNLEYTEYIKKIHKNELISTYNSNRINLLELGELVIEALKTKSVPIELIKRLESGDIDKGFEELRHSVFLTTGINFALKGDFDPEYIDVMTGLVDGNFKYDIGEIIRKSGFLQNLMKRLIASSDIAETLYKIGNTKKYHCKPQLIMEVFEEK